MLFLVSTLFKVSYLANYYYYYLKKEIENNNNKLPKNHFMRDFFFRTAKEKSNEKLSSFSQEKFSS